MQEQARHQLGYVGGLVGVKEHTSICSGSTDCKEGEHLVLQASHTAFVLQKSLRLRERKKTLWFQVSRIH